MPPEGESPRRRPLVSRVAVALVAVGVFGAVMVVSRHQPAARQVVTEGAPNGNVPAPALRGDESAPTALVGEASHRSLEPETAAPAATSLASAPTGTSGPSR